MRGIAARKCALVIHICIMIFIETRDLVKAKRGRDTLYIFESEQKSHLLLAICFCCYAVLSFPEIQKKKKMKTRR